MAITLGTRGNDGHNLVRDSKNYKNRLAAIDFTARKHREPDRTAGGKKTWVYGAKAKEAKIVVDMLDLPVVK